jgi:hypothetical protein
VATADKNKSLLVTGTLAYGCTALGFGTHPHGGTGLGLVGSIYFEPPSGVIAIRAPEDGRTRALLYTGGDAVLGASIEGWDDTVAGGVLAPLFPDSSQANNRVALEWNENDAGKLVAELGPVVFSPTNTEHPAVILYNGIAFIEASARLRLSSIRTLSVPILITGKPDAAGRVAAMGRLTDLPTIGSIP